VLDVDHTFIPPYSGCPFFVSIPTRRIAPIDSTSRRPLGGLRASLEQTVQLARVAALYEDTYARKVGEGRTTPGARPL
jgi:hypothetical protein